MDRERILCRGPEAWWLSEEARAERQQSMEDEMQTPRFDHGYLCEIYLGIGMVTLVASVLGVVTMVLL